MCAIVYLKKTQMPLREQIDNAVYNNWHSYGLIVRIGEDLEVIKECPESGEVNPDDVWNLLEKYREYDRYLHLRHNTAGATSIENTHPFLVYDDGDRKVWWMHNGTLYPFVSKKQETSNTGTVKWVDDPDGKSDTVNFAEQVITPLLEQLDGPHGKGDIKNPLLRKMIQANWSGSNRGLLVSNKEGSLFIDQWKMIDSGQDKFLASNDEYFTTVKRGPEFARREESRKKIEAERKALEEAKKGAQTGSASRTIVSIKDFTFDQKHGFYKLSESLCKVCHDWDIYEREGAIALGYATKDELKELYESEADCMFVMDWVFSDYATMYDEMLCLEDKHDRASKMIATLKTEAQTAQNRIEELERQLVEMTEMTKEEAA
jgi:hypothetical protein